MRDERENGRLRALVQELDLPVFGLFLLSLPFGSSPSRGWSTSSERARLVGFVDRNVCCAAFAELFSTLRNFVRCQGIAMTIFHHKTREDVCVSCRSPSTLCRATSIAPSMFLISKPHIFSEEAISFWLRNGINRLCLGRSKPLTSRRPRKIQSSSHLGIHPLGSQRKSPFLSLPPNPFLFLPKTLRNQRKIFQNSREIETNFWRNCEHFTKKTPNRRVTFLVFKITTTVRQWEGKTETTKHFSGLLFL